MVWRRSGDKPLSEPMMVILLTHICVTRPQWVNCHRISLQGLHRHELCPKSSGTLLFLTSMNCITPAQIPPNCCKLKQTNNQFTCLNDLSLARWSCQNRVTFNTSKGPHISRTSMTSIQCSFFVFKCRITSGSWVKRKHLWPSHNEVTKWKHSVSGIHRSPLEFPQAKPKALLFSLIRAGTNGWANNRKAGDLRPHRAHYDVTVMAACREITCWYQATRCPHPPMPATDSTVLTLPPYEKLGFGFGLFAYF